MFTAGNRAAFTLLHMGEHTPGSRLRELRERLGLSLRQAAQRAETISYGAIRQLEGRVGSWERVELGSLLALSRAYGVPLDYLVRFVFISEDAPDIATDVMKRPDDLEVHPEWMAFPAYACGAAGDHGSAKPMKDKVAYIPREHLTRESVKADDVRVYYLDDECLISDEAARVSKPFSVGDYVAIDTSRTADVGDVVSTWCNDLKTMVFLRYGVDRVGVALRTLADRRAPPAVVDITDSTVLGPVIWRGG